MAMVTNMVTMVTVTNFDIDKSFPQIFNEICFKRSYLYFKRCFTFIVVSNCVLILQVNKIVILLKKYR